MAIYRKLLIGLGVFGFLFSACTQGQGPEGKVTTAGAEAAPDVCEKPENLDNVLCQWVASELKMASPTGEIANLQIFYDETGSPYRITGTDGQGKKTIMNFSYNDYGLWKVVTYSEPDPPESENFTKEKTQTTNYNSDGSIQTRISEVKVNGQPQSSEEKYYFYVVPNVIATVFKDGAGNPTSGMQELINKDPNSGKVSSIEETKGPVVGMSITSREHWSISNFGYDFDTGLLRRIEKDSQNCLVPNRPCGQTLDPNVITIEDISYDDQGRPSKFHMSTEGEVDSNNQIVSLPHDPPDPDQESECDFKYELQTQAKLAKMNPLGIFLMLVPMPGWNLNFNDQSLFTQFSCGPVGASEPQMVMTPHWVRLWEALPEGQPPSP